MNKESPIEYSWVKVVVVFSKKVHMKIGLVPLNLMGILGFEVSCR